MNSILHIQSNTSWSFLTPYKSAAQPIPRLALVGEMLVNADVARFVASLLPEAIKNGYVHQTLLAFNAATLHDFIFRAKSLDEGTVAFLLPGLLEPLQNRSHGASKDAILGSYILLASLSHKIELSPSALKVIVASMAKSARHVQARQFVSAVVSVCAPQAEMEEFSDSGVRTIVKLHDISKELCAVAQYAGVEQFLGPLLPGLLQQCVLLIEFDSCVLTHLNRKPEAGIVEAILTSPSFPSSLCLRLTALLLEKYAEGDASVLPLLSQCYQRHASVFSAAVDDQAAEDEDLKEKFDKLALELAVPPSSSEYADTVLASANADDRVRSTGVSELLKTDGDEESISAALFACLHYSLLWRPVEDSYERVNVEGNVLGQNGDHLRHVEELQNMW